MPDIIDIGNSTFQAFFKTDYLDLMNLPFNQAHPFLGMVRVDPSAVGNVQAHGIPFSDDGGFSSGSIGTASDQDVQTTNYTLKNLYQIGQIDAKSIDLSASDEGAFERLVSWRVGMMQRAWTRNRARMLFGDGTGALGTSSATSASGSDFTQTITAATWNRAALRKRDIVNVGATANGEFRVKSVDPANKQVVLTRISGSFTPTASSVIYAQNSKDNDMQGLAGVLDATSGTKYGISIANGWQAVQKTTSSKRLDLDYLATGYLDVVDEFGEAPDTLVVSKDQMRKMIQLGEAQKVLSYNSLGTGDLSVLGVKPHLKLEGTEIPIVYDQNVPAGRAYLLNKSMVVVRTTGKGRFEPGNKGFLHYEGASNKNDRYILIYRQYGETFIVPTAHCVFSSLSTA